MLNIKHIQKTGISLAWYCYFLYICDRTRNKSTTMKTKTKFATITICLLLLMIWFAGCSNDEDDKKSPKLLGISYTFKNNGILEITGNPGTYSESRSYNYSLSAHSTSSSTYLEKGVLDIKDLSKFTYSYSIWKENDNTILGLSTNNPAAFNMCLFIKNK